MSLAKFSVRNPVLVNIATIGIIAVGAVAYLDMPREMFPEIEFEVVTVTTSYPGVGPREVESLVTIPVENAVAGVDDIEQIVSSSSEGLSVVRIELEAGTDASRRALDVESAISRSAELPDDADDPIVKAAIMERPVLTLAIASDLPEGELRDLARNLKDELTQLDGVSSVTAAGLRDREILVEVDPDRLRTLDMPISDVMAALRAQNIDLPGGRLETDRGEYFIRTMGKLETADHVRDVVVRSDARGGVITVGDVAEVRDDFADARTNGRVGGRPSVYLNVMSKTGDDFIDISDTVRGFVAGYTKLPEGTSFLIVTDASDRIRTRLNTMYSNGLMGLILVLALLFVFLNGKIAFITAVGVPVAFLGTFILMRIFGHTSNMLTMFGLVLVLGMLVDDAIVVTENVFRHLTMGKEPHQAAVDGAEEVAIPITAAVATTTAAFMALVLLPGNIGKFMRFIPIVVSMALFVSIIEAVLILPSHLAEWTRPWKIFSRKKGLKGPLVPATEPRSLGAAAAQDESPPPEAPLVKEPKWFGRMRDSYGWLLTRVVRWRKLTALSVTLVIAGLMFGALKTTRFVAFPPSGINSIAIDVEMAPGTKLEETERLIAEVEKLGLALPPEEVESVVSTIGSRPLGRSMTFGSHLGRVNLTLTDPDDRERDGRAIGRELEAAFAGVAGAERIDMSFARHGPRVGNAIEARVRGDDFETALSLAKMLEAHAKAEEGARDVRLDTELGKDEVRIRLDDESAATLGVDVATVARAVRNAFGGGIATKIQRGDEEINVVVKWPEGARVSVADLETLLITNRHGRPVPLTNFASTEVASGYGKLHRYDRKAAVTVLGDIDPKVGNAFAINRSIESAAAGILDSFPGYRVEMGGEDEETQLLLSGILRALGLALLAMYAIMAGLFRSWSQPLIILGTSVPFGVCGVVLGLWVSGSPLSMIGMVGAVALAGIVVNDSIVMVDFINKARARGMPADEAAIEAGKTRLRPIILTSVTTIMGLLPMALGIFGAEEFLKPMATAIVWGLGVSTLLILFMVPVTYVVLDGMRATLARLIGMTPGR